VIVASKGGMESKPITLRKTLRLRIVRPFYGVELEKQIASKKEELKKSGATGELTNSFWEQLKREHPDIVLWSEFRDLVTQIQKTIVPAYNLGSTILYQEILTAGRLRSKKGNEGATVKYVISKKVYPIDSFNIY
jgi:hypothetical protein